VVTLTGTISTHDKRTAAQEAAHRVARVRDVANDLVVGISGGLAKTDTELAHAVRRALAQDRDIPHERIATTVAEGRVTLEGAVNCAY
jgi:osmotically-inducible protein OsmY